MDCHSFSRGSSWPRDQTHISYIGRQILYHWATGIWLSLNLQTRAVNCSLYYYTTYSQHWILQLQPHQPRVPRKLLLLPCLVYQSCLTLCDPMELPVRLLCPWGFSGPRKFSWSGLPCPPPEDLPNPGIESRSPALQADYLLSESPGKAKAKFPAASAPGHTCCLQDQWMSSYQSFSLSFPHQTLALSPPPLGSPPSYVCCHLHIPLHEFFLSPLNTCQG